MVKTALLIDKDPRIELARPFEIEFIATCREDVGVC